MRDRKELLDVARDGVRRALAHGAHAAEVYVLARRTTSLAAQGRFMVPKEALTEGVAARVVKDGRTGQSSADGLRGLDDALARALEATQGAGASTRAWHFPPPAPSTTNVLVDDAVAAADAERVSRAAGRIHEHLLAGRGVTYAGTNLQAYHRRFAVANSHGVETGGEGAGERLEFEARVTKGAKERAARDSWSGVRPVDGALDLEAFADATIADATRALDDAPLPGGPVDRILLAPGPASQVLGIFSTSLSAEAARAGHSPLANRLGERVVSEHVTLRDEPHGPIGRNHRAVDDEGTPTRPLTLLQDGRLEALMYNAGAAHAAGATSTGHGFRRGLGAVSIQPTNLVMDAGDATLDELVEQADRAVLVTQPLMGAFVANQVTGDFSVVAPFAFYVEAGKIRHALPPTSIGGNVHRVLGTVRALGRERRTYIPGTVPALLSEGVSCAT